MFIEQMDKKSYMFHQYYHICTISLTCVFLLLCLWYFNNNIVFQGNVFFSNTILSIKTDKCSGRYVYIYDLPSRFNEDMVKECKRNQKWSAMCNFTMNGGFGPLLNNIGGVFSDHGWYATDHFNLEIIFYNRMKRYECLTNDSLLAVAFYVPFFVGFDFARYIGEYNVSVRDAASSEIFSWLEERDEWKFMYGKDHFVVGGRPTWDFRRKSDEDNDWGNKFLLLPGAKNMSVLLVESSPYGLNDFAIPYPTYFHPSKDSEVFDWQERMRKTERKWLFSFAGAPRPGDPNSIRSRLIGQCKDSSVGKVLECAVVDESKCHSPSNVMKMFQSSVFCLQPEGDSATRRSAFDSILAGCIPVFFHPGSFYTQYTWHLPKNYTTYSVFIPNDDIRKNVSIEERLKRIDPKTIKKMREKVISLIPRLIYSDPDSKLVTLEDAFDVSLKAIIRKVTKLRQDMIVGRTNDDLVEGYGWKYALLEQGDYAAVGEWDAYFPNPNPINDSAEYVISKQEQIT